MDIVKNYSDGTYSIIGLDKDDLISFGQMIKSSCLTERRVFACLNKKIDEFKNEPEVYQETA
jgi:hypothetical protein